MAWLDVKVVMNSFEVWGWEGDLSLRLVFVQQLLSSRSWEGSMASVESALQDQGSRRHFRIRSASRTLSNPWA